MATPAELCKRIGYEFQTPELLTLALSHRSLGKGVHNERLEFLGDSVLGLIIAETLYQRFPKATEGQLSRLRSNLVRGETLVKLANQFELGECLILGIGELKTGGHRRHSTLEDACEALIGALYLDAGLSRCREVVLTWFEPFLQYISAESPVRDPKSRLQETLQARGFGLPKYTVLRTEGAEHCQTFFVRCEVTELAVQIEASGLSRKQAEQQAAADLLTQLEAESK